MGTDFNQKTSKIGPKTVLKKYEEIKLTEEQINAIIEFKKEPKTKYNVSPTSNCIEEKLNDVVLWLVREKNFSKILTENLIKKAVAIHNEIVSGVLSSTRGKTGGRKKKTTDNSRDTIVADFDDDDDY
jgi:hypothetical protein